MDSLSPQPSPHHMKRSPSLLIFSSWTSLIKREKTAIALGSIFLLSFVLFLDAATPFRPFSILRRLLPDHAASAATCDYSHGTWVRDNEHAARLYSEDCPFLDAGFQCRRNGRNDTEYLNWRWQPHACDLPRFDAKQMLERSRDGRIVFVGDSIGRNQWESLICMLATGIQNKSSIYEKYGNPITKHKGFLAIQFDDYNLTVEYYRAPFLVVMGRPPPNSPDHVKKAILLDTIQWQSKRWIGADVLIFNAGHWWNEYKTVKAGNYFQEGKALNMSMDVKRAFQRILESWSLWVYKNVKMEETHVFFRSYAPSHYSNGSWDTGVFCDANTEPGTDITEEEPWNNGAISAAIQAMKAERSWNNVEYLNITYLSELRRDGHPSRHIEPGFPPDSPQDCSHWCLPGVPDVWNEIPYAHLLARSYSTKGLFGSKVLPVLLSRSASWRSAS